MFPIDHLRRIGGKNWVKFGPRSCLMPPFNFRDWVTVVHMSVQRLSKSMLKGYQNELVHSKGGRWSKLGKLRST